jgi:hypothetical protein
LHNLFIVRLHPPLIHIVHFSMFLLQESGG